MKRALTAALLSALVTASVLVTAGIGATSKSDSSSKSSSSAKKKSSKSKKARRHSRRSGTSATTPPPTMKEVLAEREKARAEKHAELAKELGVTAEKLTAALDAIKAKKLAEAVKDKQLTEAQRAAILACDKAPLTCDRSDLPAYGFGGHHGGPGIGGPGMRHGLKGSDFAKDLATELGISEDKVRSALKATRPSMGDRRGHRGGMGGGKRGGMRGGHGDRGFHGGDEDNEGASGPSSEDTSPASA